MRFLLRICIFAIILPNGAIGAADDSQQLNMEASEAFQNATPAELRQAADVLEQQGGAMDAGMMDEVQKAELPPGVLALLTNPPKDQHWLSASMGSMTGMYATMLRAAADKKEADAREDGTQSASARGDEVTRRVQEDLIKLGYEPGNSDGLASTDTTVAIAKFEASHDIPVTGEVSPQLAGIISVEVDKQEAGTSKEIAAAPDIQPDPEALKVAQQECLQEKMASAQEAQKKKRGFGRLLRAVTRTANNTGNYDVGRTVNNVYQANATADDLAAAAKDLGLTEDAVVACQNP